MHMQVDSALTLGPPGKMVHTEGAFPIGNYEHWTGHTVQAFITSCSSPDDVFIQLDGDDTNEALDKVEAYINQLPEESRRGPPRDHELKPLSSWLAVYELDSKWHRVRILEKIDSQNFRVLFVDYGNIEIVPIHKLMECPSNVIRHVEGVTPCSLNGFDGEESQEELDTLKTAVEGQDLNVEIITVHNETNKGTWRMLINLYGPDGTDIKSYVTRLLNEKRQQEELIKEKEEQQENIKREEREAKKENVKREEFEVKELVTNVEHRHPKRELKEPVTLEQAIKEKLPAVDVVDGKSKNKVCRDCGYVSKNKLDYVQHCVGHFDEQMPFSCQKCKYRSFSPYGLDLHNKFGNHDSYSG